MEYKTTLRITTLLAAVALVISIFIGRLYAVQISQPETIVSSSDNYIFLTHVPAARGNLYDRNGIEYDPKLFPDCEHCAHCHE